MVVVVVVVVVVVAAIKTVTGKVMAVLNKHIEFVSKIVGIRVLALAVATALVEVVMVVAVLY